ncbi:MAG: hypothetical protein DSM107014_04545 [Gomphosphaeria aponina SAG 52.96 = DSM 107014]|uniref:Uncharacterized protein n=1 Tax=Gomphosphaeria aponina SAG 52.96 = DSM 107014 TaxID=1521640 RepID=A0A941GVU7_9CHRO|nr:hypothetical protein [Gomphosphaeria aponina SAG 52.96 = DSM 107014]
MSELEKNIGQLQLYQWALEAQESEGKLFLGIINYVLFLK